MTLQSLNQEILWPNIVRVNSTPSITGTGSQSAAGHYYATVFKAKTAMTISHVGGYIQAVSGSPTCDVRVETVDATTGLPTGTLWNSGTTNDSNLLSGTLTTGWLLSALTHSASISLGDYVAIVFRYNSGTSYNVGKLASFVLQATFPYDIVNTASTTKSALTGSLLALGNSATTFYTITNCLVASAVTNTTFNNTNSQAQGARFQVPFKCRCIGLKWFNNSQGSQGDFNAAIYDDAGTELSSSSTAFDKDIVTASAAGGLYLPFDSPVTLSPATWYRAAIEPTSATNVAMSHLTLPSLDYRSAMPGGTNFFYVTRTSGTWTDTQTDHVPLIDLMIDQLDDGVSTSGGGPLFQSRLIS